MQPLMLMASLGGMLDAAKGGIQNVAKNQFGRWIGWRGARITHKLLLSALGDDVDNIMELVAKYGTWAEFILGMTEKVLSPEMEKVLGPSRAAIMRAILNNLSEHIGPEYFEEMKRIHENTSLGKDQKHQQIKTIWGNLVLRVNNDVAPGEARKLKSVTIGAATFYFVPRKTDDCQMYKSLIAELNRPNARDLLGGARGAGGDIKVTRMEGSPTNFTEGEADLDEALDDLTGTICSHCMPHLHRGFLLSAAGGGSTGIWDKLFPEQQKKALDNLAALEKAIAEARHKAKQAAKPGSNITLSALEEKLANTDFILDDITQQIIRCKDKGAITLLTIADSGNIWHILAAVKQSGGHASADFVLAQQVANLTRWAKDSATNLAAWSKGLPGWVSTQWQDPWVQRQYTRLVRSLYLFAAGFIITFGFSMTNDFMIGHAWRILGVSFGLGLMAPFPICLFLLNMVIITADEQINKRVGAVFAVFAKKFDVEVPEEPKDWVIFGRGDTVAKLAKGLGVLICLAWGFLVGTVEVDALTHGHKLFWGARLMVFTTFAFAIAGVLNDTTTKNVSETAMLATNRRMVTVGGFIDFLTRKPVLTLAAAVPAVVGLLLVTATFFDWLPSGGGFEKNASRARFASTSHWVWEQAVPEWLIMPGGKQRYTPKELFGHYDEDLRVCSTGLAHLLGGSTPESHEDWDIKITFFTLLRADYNPEPREMLASDAILKPNGWQVPLPDGNLVLLDDLFGPKSEGCWIIKGGAILAQPLKAPVCQLHRIDSSNWQPALGPSDQVTFEWWENPPETPKVHSTIPN